MIQIKPEIFQEVLSAYDLGEGTITYKAYGEGHINNTSLVTVTGKETHRFILQRINTDIFTNPKSLMEYLRRYFLPERHHRRTRWRYRT